MTVWNSMSYVEKNFLYLTSPDRRKSTFYEAVDYCHYSSSMPSTTMSQIIDSYNESREEE